MKSNVISFKKGQNKSSEILNETEKVALYNGLNHKQALRLRLLVEEINGIVKELVDIYNGEFWIENDNLSYSINLSIQTDFIDDESKKKLISVATSGKNELAKGFMGKIRSIIDYFSITSDVKVIDVYGFYNETNDGISMHNSMEYSYWSLDKYRTDIKDKDSEWDELEKSIVANLADNVTVGVMGRKVQVVVKKTF